MILSVTPGNSCSFFIPDLRRMNEQMVGDETGPKIRTCIFITWVGPENLVFARGILMQGGLSEKLSLDGTFFSISVVTGILNRLKRMRIPTRLVNRLIGTLKQPVIHFTLLVRQRQF